MSEDIRTTKTKAKIKNAFLELLKDYTYEHISVTDIANKADINRVTFYTHYIDKACLLSDLLEDIKKNFITSTIQHANNINTDDNLVKYSISLVNALLDIALINKDLIAILSHKENAVIAKLIEEQTKCFIENSLNKIHANNQFKYPLRHITAFTVPAFMALIINYISEPNPMPLEQFRSNLVEITENFVKANIFTK